uniref:RING-type domain-containing protein n=1 Tax=Kalanchoe fedtschenkoi TaxID=63787 RepID=A0A7N0TZE8_KALFE
MGKRNRTKFLQPKTPPPQPYPSPPDGVPCSSGKIPQSVDPSEPLKHHIAAHSNTETSVRFPHFDPRHNFSLSRSIVLKQAQNLHYGHQYSRRKSNHHASVSGPFVKGVPTHDEKLPFKLPHQTMLEMQYQAERLLNPDNRIRFNPTEMETVPANFPDPAKVASCTVCQKPLRRKPCSGAMLSSSDVSVVAVLVCGHLYHAQCLEQNTCHEHLHDPPCPLCSGMLAGTSINNAYAS